MGASDFVVELEERECTCDCEGCKKCIRLYDRLEEMAQNKLKAVLEGAFNDKDNGHIESVILQREVSTQYSRHALQRNLTAALDQHSAFASFVLLGAVRTTSAKDGLATTMAHVQAFQSTVTLALLRGHEETLLALIADFVGVVRGRQLRNAREAMALLRQQPPASIPLPYPN